MMQFYSGFFRKVGLPLAAVLFGVLIFGVPFGTPLVNAGEGHKHAGEIASEDSSTLSWQDKLKNQLDRENAAVGKPAQRDQVEKAMNRLMSEITKGMEASKPKGAAQGPFSDMAKAQQMDRSFFLGPSGAAETLGNGGAGVGLGKLHQQRS